MDTNNISKLIKEKRESLNLSQEQLGEKIGVTGPTISKWENGKVDDLKRKKIVLLAEVLKVAPATLMGWDESKYEDEEIAIICRTAQNMPSEKRKQLIEMMRIVYNEKFGG